MYKIKYFTISLILFCSVFSCTTNQVSFIAETLISETLDTEKDKNHFNQKNINNDYLYGNHANKKHKSKDKKKLKDELALIAIGSLAIVSADKIKNYHENKNNGYPLVLNTNAEPKEAVSIKPKSLGPAIDTSIIDINQLNALELHNEHNIQE